MKKQYVFIGILLTFFGLEGLGSASSGTRFLDAKELYNHTIDGEKVIRRSIINAVNLGYRIHANSMGASGGVLAASYLPTVNEGIETIKGIPTAVPMPYWDSVLGASFAVKTSLTGSIFPVIAFHRKNDSIEGDYPKIMIAFHGTAEAFHWATNTSGAGVKYLTIGRGGKEETLSGHFGFLSAGLSIDMRDFRKSITSLIPSSTSLEDCQIIVTGHSLGGGIASVFSLRLLDNLKGLDNRESSIVSITMGQPPLWSKLSVKGAFKGSYDHDRIVELMGKKNLLRLVTNASKIGKEDMVALWGTYPATGALTSVGFGVGRLVGYGAIGWATGLVGIPLSMLIIGDPLRAFYDHSVFDATQYVYLDLVRKDYSATDALKSSFPHDMKFYEAAIMKGPQI